MKKLTKKQSTALEASIEVWKHKLTIDDPGKIGMGVCACPLCIAFRTGRASTRYIDCGNCPIALAGYEACYGSPYGDAEDALYCWQHSVGSKAAFRRAARKQIKFMESLRDKP